MEDASEFEDVLEVKGGGRRPQGHEAVSSVMPNAIAALLLHLRDATEQDAALLLRVDKGNPIVYLFRFLLFGEGDTAPVTRRGLARSRTGWHEDARPSTSRQMTRTFGGFPLTRSSEYSPSTHERFVGAHAVPQAPYCTGEPHPGERDLSIISSASAALSKLETSRLALKISTPTSGLACRRSAIRSTPSPSGGPDPAATSNSNLTA